MRGILFGAALGIVSGNVQSCEKLGACVASGTDGACVYASSNCCSGSLVTGLCPGPSDIQCCVEAVAADDDTTFGENPFYYENWCGHEVGTDRKASPFILIFQR